MDTMFSILEEGIVLDTMPFDIFVDLGDGNGQHFVHATGMARLVCEDGLNRYQYEYYDDLSGRSWYQ